MDFKTALANYIASCQKKTFKWGKFDCCLFVFDFIAEATGKDIAEWYRGRYKTEEEAFNLLQERRDYKRRDKGLLRRALSYDIKRLGFDEVTHERYQSGDFCVVDTPQGEAMGLIYNGKVWCSAPKGLVTLPTNLVVKRWRAKWHL